MAVAFRNYASPAGATQSTLTLTEPSGAATDDILIALVYVESNATVTAPSGWTNVFAGTTMTELLTSPDTWLAHLYWIRRGGSAPALAWTFSSAYSQGAIAAYSGAYNTGDPFSFGAHTSRNDGSVNTFPDISGTTINANEMLIWWGTNYQGGGSSTQPTGFTERLDIVGQDITFADKVLATAGATGTVTGASAGGGGGNAASKLVGLSDSALGGGATYVPQTIIVSRQAVHRASNW